MTISEIKQEYIIRKMLDIEPSECYLLMGGNVLPDNDKIKEHRYFEHGSMTFVAKYGLK